jgi:chromosome segregation ATPase
MFSNGLESLLGAASADTVTNIFISLTLAVLIFALAFRQSRFADQAPTLMTSLGILGTFVGVVVGLLHFNPAHIDQSIAGLLSGLKTAFFTSLVGMSSSIIFKNIDTLFFASRRDSNETKQNVTPDDIFKEMRHQTESLRGLKAAIEGQEEGSLIGQFKLLRSDIGDFRTEQQRSRQAFDERLWSELQSFSEMLSKSATEQVIDALRQVIVEFNQRLTEQFGDNFQRLDNSVKKLVEWQAQYKDQVETMSDQYRQSVESLLATREAVAGVGEECKEIPLAMAELKNVLQVNQHQIAELQRHLDAFVQVRDKAIEAVPRINQQLTAIGIDLKQGAENMKLVMLEGATEFRDSVTRTNTAMNDMANSVASQAEETSSHLRDLSRELQTSNHEIIHEIGTQTGNLRNQLEDTVGQVMTTLRNNTESTLTGVEQQIEKALNHTGEGVNRQLAALDEALQQELNRAMSELGSALATIASHIVDKYQEHVTDQAA